MPTVVTLPACLMDCYKVLYPNLDFSRVAFYSGLPTVWPFGSADGFTMASGAAIPDIRVYIENYKPCTKDTFLTIAHELVHVVQIQGMLGGGRIPGSWTAYYTSHFLGCAGGWSTCDNELEKEAYDFADGVVRQLRHRRQGPRLRGHGARHASVQLHRRAVADRQHDRRADLCRGAAGRSGPGQDLEQRRADLVLVAQLARVPDRRGLLDLRVQQYRRRDRRGAGNGDRRGDRRIDRRQSLGGPWAPSSARGSARFVGGIVGGAIGWAINGIINWIGGLFSGPSARIWFTAFDGDDIWVIPDMPVSQNGHTLTSAGPAMAVFNGQLYPRLQGHGQRRPLVQRVRRQLVAGERSRDHPERALADQRRAGARRVQRQALSRLQGLRQRRPLVQRVRRHHVAAERSRDHPGRALKDRRGAGARRVQRQPLPGLQGLRQRRPLVQRVRRHLVAAERSRDHAGRALKDQRGAGARRVQRQALPRLQGLRQQRPLVQRVRRHRVAAERSRDHPERTLADERGPALAVYNGLLYLAYRGGGSDDIWYNVFDGNSWLAQDISVTQGGIVQTAQGPALAAFEPFLFMAYRDNS